MYNYLCLFFCCCLSQLLLAQDYMPIIINGEVFFKTELLTTEGLLPAEITVTNFKKIDGQLYNRVFFKRGLEGDMLVGYFREDSNLGQVHFLPLNGGTESLVYDISLEVGEVITLPARWCDGQNNDQVEVIAVNMVNGLREVVFDRQVGEGELCETLTFLEGVGPSASLLFPYFRDAILPNGVALRLCHASRQAVVYYPMGVEVDLCGFTTVSTREPAAQLLDVFPNPVRSALVINGAQAGDPISIYHANGQLWRKLNYTGLLDCQDWPKGLYFLRLTRENGAIGLAKIVRQ